MEDVTANIVNNSAIYTDQLVTPPLTTNDIGGVYYCEVSINGDRYNDSIVLDFIGEYTMHYYVTRIRYLHIHCMNQGVLTLIRPVEPSVTGIKMESSDREAIFRAKSINQGVLQLAIKQLRGVILKLF